MGGGSPATTPTASRLRRRILYAVPATFTDADATVDERRETVVLHGLATLQTLDQWPIRREKAASCHLLAPPGCPTVFHGSLTADEHGRVRRIWRRLEANCG
jgi:hypothetical protein